MQWFYGGEWVADGEGWAFLQPLRTIHPAAPLMGTGRADWFGSLSSESKVRTRQVTPAIADRVLDQTAAFSEEFGFAHLQGFRHLLDEGLRHRRDAKLCEVLAKFGPLGWDNGVVGVGPVFSYFRLRTGSQPDDWGSFEPGWFARGVYLDTYHLEMSQLAEAWGIVVSPQSRDERLEQLPRLLGNSLSARRELEPLPVRTSEGLTWENRPFTLRAYLWQRVFWILGREGLDRQLCKYCGIEFHLTRHRGPQTTYCDVHRAPRYRVAVHRGTAPALRGRSDPAPFTDAVG